MIKALIRFSAENRFLVLLATAVCVGYGVYTLDHIPVDAIPDLSDTQVIVYSRWDRSPDIIEDQVTYPIVTRAARRAQRQGRPRLLRLRLLLRVRDLQGRHRHLLGAEPGPRVPLQDPAAPAARACRTELGPDATGVGWVFQYALVDDSRAALAGGPADAAGLEPALPAAVGPGRRGGGRARRLRAAVPGHGRPQPAQGLRARDHGRGGGDPARATTRWAGGCSSSRARSTWSAAAATCASDGGPRADRPQDRREAGRPCCCGTWARSRSAPRSGAGSPTSTAWATRWAASSSCATARTRAR